MPLTADLALSSTGDLLLENGDLSLVYDDALAVQLFKIMLRSEYGDMERFPELGMDIKEFMQRQNTRENADGLQERVYSSIEGIDYFNEYSLIVDSYPTDLDDIRLDISMINPEGAAVDLGFGMDLVHGIISGVDEYALEDHNIYLPDRTERIEKINIKTRTNTIRLQLKPYEDSITGYDIQIYKASEFDINDEDVLYEEVITDIDSIVAAQELDFTTTDSYTEILTTKEVRVMFVNDTEVDVTELESNDWIYTIDDDLSAIISSDGNIRINTYYNQAFTSGYLGGSINKSVTPEAIAPELEDNKIYEITTRAYLMPGQYFVRYESYLVKH